MKTIKAINPKNQSLVNKCIKAMMRYDELNDLRCIADDNDDMKACKKLNKQCLNAMDKYLEYYDMLPKNQKKVLDKELM